MELVHALNRGVDKRDLFLDDRDRLRFIYGLYIFNNQYPVDMAALKAKGLAMSFSEPREPFVDVHGWCLMNNHYHLIVSPRSENGIVLFLRKLNIGYAKYFNERYGRSGTLFQGRTKKIPITREAQFLYILHYVHLNALDLLKGAENWRERDKRKIPNVSESLAHLGRYRWSSYLDYNGVRNFPEILQTNLFDDESGTYRSTLLDYLRDAEPVDTTSLRLE